MSGVTWIDPIFAGRLTTALAHFLWQGTLLAAIAAAVQLGLRTASARLRSAIQTVILCGMGACVPLTFCFGPPADPGIGAAVAAAAEPQVDGAAAADRGGSASEHIAEGRGVTTAGGRTPTTAVDSGSVSGVFRERGSMFGAWCARHASAISGVYLASVLVLLARLAVGFHGGHRLRQSAAPLADSEITGLLRRQARRIGLRRLPRLGGSDRISVPVVVGVLQPMIVLPATLLTGLTRCQLQALITHELAHIRRHDLAINLLQRLAEAVLFFHPAVWYVSRQVSRERELAADDRVLAAGASRPDYADALVRMAELSLSLRRHTSLDRSVTVAASGRLPSTLGERVRRVLDGPHRVPLRLTRSGWAVLTMSLLMAVCSPIAVRAFASTADSSAADQNRLVDSAGRTADAERTAGDPLAGPTDHRTDADEDADRDDEAGGDRNDDVGGESAAAGQEPVPVPIIITGHVILHDGEIVTWEQVQARLDEAAAEAVIQPQFLVTHEGHARAEALRERRWELYKRLYDAGRIRGMSIGSLSPRTSKRLDAIRTPADLVPDPARRLEGRVLGVDGRPLADAEVFLLPEEHINGVYLKDGRVRNPFDEHLTRSDADGQFVIHEAAGETQIAAVHPNGFAVMSLDEFRRSGTVRLREWATVRGRRPARGDGSEQSVDFTCYPVPGISFHIYETAIDESGGFVQPHVPPGKVTVQRSLPGDQGTSYGFPAATAELAPGAEYELELGPVPDDVRARLELMKRELEERRGERDPD